MTDKKISELTAGSVLSGDELVMIVQGGVTKQTTIADIMVGSSAVGGEELAGETDAMGIDFTYHTDITKQHYISDLTTPANDYNSTPYGKLTYTSPSLKMTRQSDGVYRYVNHNLVLRSQEFDNATWTLTDATFTANDTTAPDGTATADKFVGTTVNSIARNTTLIAIAAGIIHRISFYVKRSGDFDWFHLAASDGTAGTNGINFWWNINTGAVGSSSTAGSGWSYVAHTIAASTNGFYRITADFLAGHATLNMYILGVAADGGTTRTATSTYWAWGAQLKRIPVNDAGGYTYATGYLATTTAAVYDLPYEWSAALASQGILIEEARTNLILKSQEFDDAAKWLATGLIYSANSVTAPDGTTTADTVTAQAANNSHRTYQGGVVGAPGSGTNVAWSLFAKKGTHRYVSLNGQTDTGTNWITAVFDLDSGGTTATQTATGAGSGTIVSTSMIDAGNGWYRLVLVGSMAVATNWKYAVHGLVPAATGNTFSATNGDINSWLAAGTETVHLWGAQYELGAFPSSPIHTIAATVTRAVDNISIATSAFPWSAATGTGYASYNIRGALGGTDSRILQNTTTGRMVYINWAANPITDATTQTLTYDGVNFPIGLNALFNFNTIYKAATSWGGNLTISVNGAAVVSAAFDGSMGAGASIYLGSDGGSGGFLNGTLQHIVILKREMTDPELVTRST